MFGIQSKVIRAIRASEPLFRPQSEVIHDGHRAVSVANLVEVLFLRKAIAGRYVQMFVGGDRADQV